MLESKMLYGISMDCHLKWIYSLPFILTRRKENMLQYLPSNQNLTKIFNERAPNRLTTFDVWENQLMILLHISVISIMLSDVLIPLLSQNLNRDRAKLSNLIHSFPECIISFWVLSILWMFPGLNLLVLPTGYFNNAVDNLHSLI